MLNWLKKLFSRNIVSLVVVRRYSTPTGYVGELYHNGKQIGCTCDLLSYEPAFYKMKSEHVISKKEFTDSDKPGTLRIGANEPLLNSSVKKHVLTLTRRSYIELDVRNNFVMEE